MSKKISKAVIFTKAASWEVFSFVVIKWFNFKLAGINVFWARPKREEPMQNAFKQTKVKCITISINLEGTENKKRKKIYKKKV